MKNTGGKKTTYRVPPSQYWSQYWNTYLICSLATCQLLMTLTIAGMEIGNGLVDLYRANVYSGFWSFPFTISATIATYTCVCAKKSQTKAIVALLFQLIAIIVLLVVIGFLIAFISSNYTLCLASQCNQNSTTFVRTSSTNYFTFSSALYAAQKQAFIICEFVCAIIFIIFSIIYIILYLKCVKKLPRIHSIIHVPSNQNGVNHKSISSITKSSRPLSKSNVNNSSSDITDQTGITPPSTEVNYESEKVCPKCQHVSPYIPNETILKCPKCDYQSQHMEQDLK